MRRFLILLSFFALLAPTAARATGPAGAVAGWSDHLDESLIDYFDRDPSVPWTTPDLSPPPQVKAVLSADALALLSLPAAGDSYPLSVGRLRGRIQQAMILQMAQAVREGRVADAQSWRVQIDLPRGVSASEGELLLQNLAPEQAQRELAVQSLVREAITWQTARVRQLLADAGHAAEHTDAPLPGRLAEELSEASTLANLPQSLRKEAYLTGPATESGITSAAILKLSDGNWANVAPQLGDMRSQIESHLPNLLSATEKSRRERILLKLVTIIPKEYQGGVRDGKVSTPLEYREAVGFTEQAHSYADELAPIWLANDPQGKIRDSLIQLDAALDDTQHAIARKADPQEIADTLAKAAVLLQGPFNISLHRGGTTADIVDEVMLEARRLLSSSLAAANAGNWSEAESQRLEAYTTYDPDLEARLMPRDPQLATDIEHLLLDGLDKPGVKSLLDQRIAGPELEAAYSRVSDAFDKATAILKNGVSPTAAAVNAGSIVLREGLEGLLVIVAILAGLRGDEHRRKRHMIWYGVLLSMVATAATVVLSTTVIKSLHNYGEIIEAVTSILAIVILLLITNWLFQQIYWRQWVCTLKGQASRDGAWHLVTVGFLIGYREGFETVLFLQGMVMDVGAMPVTLGVIVGSVILIALGCAALIAGMKLPYFKLLLGTALLIGLVLVTFVGTGVRSMQTVGWLPVHKMMPYSWPAWFGQWLGVYNSWETLGSQIGAAVMVIGTWQVSRWRSRRASAKRQAERAINKPARDAAISLGLPVVAEGAVCKLNFTDPNLPCAADCESENETDRPVQITIHRRQPEAVEEAVGSH